MLTLAACRGRAAVGRAVAAGGQGAAGGSGGAWTSCSATRRCWRRSPRAGSRAARERGRPSIAIETYVRLMVVKHRCGWGYETLVREVSDSLHLRRFCRIALDARVPDESTVRKLTRRLGAEVVAEITRALIAKATREKRFRARAVRIDSTVIEADVKYPTDAGLAAHGVRALAREGRKLAAKIGESATRCAIARGRWGARCAAISRTIRRRTGRGEGRGARADRADRASCWNARSARRGGWPPRRARRRAGAAPGPSCARPPSWRSSPTAARRSPSRSASASPARRSPTGWSRSPTPTPADPQGQARQAERVRLRHPARRGHAEHQARRARVHPAARLSARQPDRGHAAARRPSPSSQRLGLSPARGRPRRRLQHRPDQRSARRRWRPERVFISGRQQPGSQTHPAPPTALPHRRRRPHQPPQTRLRHAPQPAQRRPRPATWTGWATLAYNLDTYTRLD